MTRKLLFFLFFFQFSFSYVLGADLFKFLSNPYQVEVEPKAILCFECEETLKRYEKLEQTEKNFFAVQSFSNENTHSFLEMVRIVLTGKNNEGKKDKCGVQFFKEVNSDICKVMICGAFLSLYTLVVSYNHLTPSEKEKFPSFLSYLKAHFSATRPRGWHISAASFLFPTIVLGGGLKILSLWALHQSK